jgi:hypothetical protein
MTDTQILTAAWLILAAHIVALAMALFGKRGIRPLLPVNIAVAAIMLLGVAARGHYLFAPPDWPVIALGLIEAGVIMVSIAAWRRARGLKMLSAMIFALHLLATIGALVFMLTFTMDRLI